MPETDELENNAIEKVDVENVARLAKLRFTEPEKEKLTHELTEIVTYVKKLNELNTESVNPTSHVLDIHNVMRPDETETSLTREQVLQNAPARKMGFFSVPKVIAHDK